jgi:F-type H+-transporting ATPase subunit b
MFLLAFAEQSIQLFPDGTLFIHIALILIMIAVLNRTVFKPINEILDRRERNQHGGFSEADEIRETVAEKRSEYERSLLAARTESYELIERERSEAVATRQQKIDAARTEAAELLANEKAQLKDAVAEARVDIVREAHKMADSISANILK